MFEIELRYKINGREVRCDQFVDAIKMQVTETIRNAIQLQMSTPPTRQSVPQQNIPAERRAYGLDEAAKLLSVSKATISRRIREGKIRAIRVGSRVLLPSESIQKILQEAP
jgi:excisionase family DNA binding protein